MLAAFPGDVLYAVKCNDTPEVLTRTLGRRRAPVRHRVDRRGAGGARRCCPRRAATSCTRSRARRRSPRPTTGMACGASSRPCGRARQDPGRHRRRRRPRAVRPPGRARRGRVLALTGKFGVRRRRGRRAGAGRAAATPRAVGLTFHVGSQCVDPGALRAGDRPGGRGRARRSGPIDDLDVGGGFPAAYQGDEPPFEAFVAAIERAVARAWARPAGCSASRAGRWSPTAPRCWPGSSCAGTTASTSTTASTAIWPS